VSLQIDSATIRRLRDALLAEGNQSPEPAADINCPHRAAARARVAPFAETMYLVMLADGDCAPQEMASVRGAIRILTQGLLADSDLDDMLQRCEAAAKERGAAAMLQTLGSKLCAQRNDRETAFTLAAAIALADDTVTDEETSFMDDVAEWFGVSSRRAAELLGEVQSRSGG
jgi:uncharacterized tellurite resistance protein B-like protein